MRRTAGTGPCHRMFDRPDRSESAYDHITLKVPGEPGACLIDPFGLHCGEVTASGLVEVDIDGNVPAPTDRGVNRAGFVRHAVFHRHLPDAHRIAHTHATAGMAVASPKGGLRPISFHAASPTERIAYHDFDRVTVRPEGRRAMLLRDHGGRTVAEGFLRHWLVQRACEIRLATPGMSEAIRSAGGRRRGTPARSPHGASAGRAGGGGPDGLRAAGLIPPRAEPWPLPVRAELVETPSFLSA